MRICNLYRQKTDKLGNIAAGTLVSLVNSELNIDKEYYIVTNKKVYPVIERTLVNVQTGELINLHTTRQVFIHQDAALVIDFVDRS